MRFDITVPCAACPFRRNGRHAVRLRPARVREVTGNMLDPDGTTFSCHKECHGKHVKGVYEPSAVDVHCAGALIFAERHNSTNRMLQIAERFGLYYPERFRTPKQRRLVFATVEEMLAAAL